MTTELRDVSKAEAARLTGHSPNTLTALWDSIPTAYVTAGGRYRVALWGLERWQAGRGRDVSAEVGPASSSAVLTSASSRKTNPR